MDAGGEKMVAKWEYKVIPLPLNLVNSLEDKLTEISKEGWELVNIIESPSLRKYFKTETISFAILKKPIT